jgi:nucleotide-binding universal stress UspA family protein
MKKRATRKTTAPKSTPRSASRPRARKDELSRMINRILVPIDFSMHSKNALKFAIPMAEQVGAELRLVYVVEPTVYPADLGFGQVVLPGVEDELREKGSEELKELIREEIKGRVKASSTVRTGRPHQEILHEAEERNVDLIIVATHGHTGVEHMLFGSTAERIVRNAHCPVLTIRPQAEK